MPATARRCGYCLRGDRLCKRHRAPPVSAVPPPPTPTHYKVLCISLYNEDVEKIDALVRELRARGCTRANRSAVLRAAVDDWKIRDVGRPVR